MTVLKETITIERSPRQVFAYLSDFSSCAEWDPTVLSAKRTSSGPPAVGSLFHVVCAMPLGSLSLQYEILEFEAERKLVLLGRSRFFDVKDTIVLTATPTGCKLDYTAAFVFKGPIGLLAPRLEPGLKRMGHKSIQQGLKAALDDCYPAPGISRRNARAERFLPTALSQFSRLGYRRSRANWKPVSAYMGDKHVVLTGATAGLGEAAATALAQLGAQLTLIVRNREKGQQLKEQLQHETGNTRIALEIADLSLMSDVDRVIRSLNKKGEAVDVLINNAGALFNPRQETAEGLEQSFALLLLAPFRLTEGLFPLLEKSASGRVVNVVSGGLYSQKLNVQDLQNEHGKYSGSVAYARAKRALMVKTEQWAEDWARHGIIVNAMHPGWADTPGVRSALPQFHWLTRPILRTAEEGADTAVWLAAATEAGKVSGKLWLDREPRTTHLLKSTRESEADRATLRELLAQWPQAGAVRAA